MEARIQVIKLIDCSKSRVKQVTLELDGSNQACRVPKSVAETLDRMDEREVRGVIEEERERRAIGEADDEADDHNSTNFEHDGGFQARS